MKPEIFFISVKSLPFLRQEQIAKKLGVSGAGEWSYLQEVLKTRKVANAVLPFLRDYRLDEADLEKVFQTLAMIPLRRKLQFGKSIFVLLRNEEEEAVFFSYDMESDFIYRIIDGGDTLGEDQERTIWINFEDILRVYEGEIDFFLKKSKKVVDVGM